MDSLYGISKYWVLSSITSIYVPNTEYCPVHSVSNLEIPGIEQYGEAQISSMGSTSNYVEGRNT